MTQGIHLPGLVRLPELFRVRNIMDVDAAGAAAVAARHGATTSSSIDELLADESVDVVAVCSPHPFHAAQVIAACQAGKRAVLCEKPFATTREDAEQIQAAAKGSGTHIVVGAMHAYDPAWVAASCAWSDLPEQVETIRSTIVLPFNELFEDWGTELPGRVLPARTRPIGDARIGIITARMLGLAIHDLPLVRSFLPDWRNLVVTSADLLDPVGYLVTLEAGGRSVQLVGSFRNHWKPEWRLEVYGGRSALEVEFPPPYVHGGSAVATLHAGSTSRTFGTFPFNGYEGEWRHIWRLLNEPGTQNASVGSLVDDLAFAVQIAEKSGEFMAEELGE